MSRVTYLLLLLVVLIDGLLLNHNWLSISLIRGHLDLNTRLLFLFLNLWFAYPVKMNNKSETQFFLSIYSFTYMAVATAAVFAGLSVVSLN